MTDTFPPSFAPATISNPNTSEEAKQRAQDILDGSSSFFSSLLVLYHQTHIGCHFSSLGNTDAGDTSSNSENSKSASSKSDGEKNSGNVIGGHKANLHNPNTSDESKERSRQVLSEQGVDIEE